MLRVLEKETTTASGTFTPPLEGDLFSREALQRRGKVTHKRDAQLTFPPPRGLNGSRRLMIY